MILEISLHPPFTFPRLFRAQSDEPPQQEYHWVGHKQNVQNRGTENKNQNQNSRNKNNEQIYRLLSSITLGEVEDSINLFEHQLIPAHQNWIGKNHFCKIPLKRKKDGRPPVIFGRVKTCYPSDGVLDNIEDIELLFPKPNGKPDLLLVQKGDISLYSQKLVESYYTRVQFLASPEDMADLTACDPLLMVNGFIPEFESGYYSLLEMTGLNQSTYPWLYVIGSRWFDSVPDSLQMEVRAKLEKMLGWNKQIFNYHPDWLPKEINTLNRVLGFKFGFTSTVLTEPETPQETAFIVNKTFRNIFEQEAG